MDRMPHIWCPGCGIGTTVNCFTRALESSKLNLDKVAVVSGIGCTGRVAGYANLDSFHTTHGRAIPFATGLKLSNPELQVVVYSGDGDLFAIGGNHFIHAARRNMDIKVICVNNLTYAMTGGQTAPTTPGQVISATSPYGVFEPSFNLVQLAEAAGASLRGALDHLSTSSNSAARMEEVLHKKGFCFIEVLSPCPTLYQRRNKMGDGLDAMKFYKQVSKMRNGAPTSECALTKAGEIVVGKFVDRDRPDYLELLKQQMTESLGRSLRGSGGLMQRGLTKLGLTEIRIAGFGGQGVILAAAVIGKAAAIFEGGYATMTQSFGPEARGGSSSAQVILSGEPILYPYVTQPDILVVMSQEAYTRFSPQLKPGGILIAEQELVRIDQSPAGRPRLRRSRHPPRRGTGPQGGAEHRDGRLLRRRDATCSTRTACARPSPIRFHPPCRSSTCRPSTRASSTAPNWSTAWSESVDAEPLLMLETES